ncbi:hypothetical protein ACFQO4_00640 [Saliphagus sp. GCM10025334]
MLIITISDTRRRYLKGIAATAAAATGLFDITASPTGAQETRGGPIILLGLDSELTPASPDHGTPQEHADMVEALLGDVTNENDGILVIGAKSEATAQRYWGAVGEAVDEDVTFVNGAEDIANATFDGYAMVGVASSDYQLEPIREWGDPPEGLTDEENEVLVERGEDLAEFVNSGGGLLGNTQDGMTTPYGYVDPLGEFEIVVGTDGEGYVDIEVSDEGEAIGLTQEGMSGWCCWHDVFPEFPDFFDVLIYNREVGSEGENEAAAVGGVVIIPVEVAISIDGPDETEIGASEGFDVRLQNIGDEETPETVHVEFTLTREDGIEDGDVILEYSDEDDEWIAIELREDNGSLSGTYGPANGFSLPEDYDETIEIRSTFEVADDFTVEIDVRGVGAEGEHYANVSTTVTVTAEVERPGGEMRNWPDSCEEISEEEGSVLSVDGSHYQGILSPDSQDAIQLDMDDGEFAAVTARFEMSEELQLRDDGDASISTIDGDPIDQLESVEQRTYRGDRIGYRFYESGDYEFLLFSEVDIPCIELSTADDSAGSWSLALAAGIDEPPTIDETRPLSAKTTETRGRGK